MSVGMWQVMTVASAVVLAGCGGGLATMRGEQQRKDDAPVAVKPAPTVRRVDGLAKPAFKDHGLEERCGALEAFLRGYLTQYSVTLDVAKFECDKFNASFSSSMQGKDPRADSIEILLHGTENTARASKVRIHGLTTATPAVDVTDAEPLDETFQASLLAYLEGASQQRMIFGLDPAAYQERLRAITRDPGLERQDSYLRFELTPNPEYAIGAGSVEYFEVPAAYFERVSKGYLECKDIECLNDGKARYMLIDEHLVLTRKTEGDPNVSAGQTSFHVITLDAAMLGL